jgi:DNA repair exonuclease SbcCD ATPase subunit
MNIELKSLKLTNFKGIRNLTIPFEKETSIFGDNATGKTTIFDSFTFLLFGKDSFDRKDFNIKTLDDSGVSIPKIPHEVEGEIEVDGQSLTLKRCFNEKWTRRRGEETAEFTGHETLFFINDVPCQANEYKAKIDGLLNEGLFKLITSALYFNNTLKWENRRQILISIAGEIDDSEIAGTKKEFADLLNMLNGKKFEDYKKEIAAKKKKLKDELSTLPARIEEVTRSIPEPVDYAKVQKDISSCQHDVQIIEGVITDKSKAHEEATAGIRVKQDEIHKHKSALQNIEFNVKSEQQKKDNEKTFATSGLKQDITGKKSVIDRLLKMIVIEERGITETETKITSLRKEWETENAKELKIDPNVKACPTCKRPYETDDVDAKEAELQKNFDAEKVKKLASITANGKSYAEELKEKQNSKRANETELQKAKDELALLEASLPKETTETPVSIDGLLKDNKEYQKIKADISKLELEILEVPKLDVAELNKQKSDIGVQLDELKAKLAVRETIEKQTTRKKELMDSEKTLSQELSELEGREFLMDSFTKAKIDMVEQRINGKFNLVTFKMFNTLINGGIEETCETMMGGVPWSDLNSAGKIQAGVDIINTLCEFHDVYAPIFLDNRETCNEIPEVKSQVVNLFVTHDKELIIK